MSESGPSQVDVSHPDTEAFACSLRSINTRKEVEGKEIDTFERVDVYSAGHAGVDLEPIQFKCKYSMIREQQPAQVKMK